MLGRTFVALLTTLSLLLAGFALATPVSADPTPDKHCDLHDTTPKAEGAAVAPGTTGTIMVGGESVGYTISADGKTVTFTESVEFCVKASLDNSGAQSGTTFTVDWLNPGDNVPGISYFVVYGLNEDNGPDTGSITIRKNSVPDNDDDFPFTATGGLPSFSLDDDADGTLPRERTFTDLAPGTYTVTEGIVEHWTLTQLDCSTGGTGVTSTRTATIMLTAGAHVTCTFVNVKHATQAQGSITIRKNSVPDNDEDFAFTTTGAGLVGFSLDDDTDSTLPRELTFTGLALGTYTVTEGAVDQWVLTQLDCSEGGTGDIPNRTATIVLTAGAHVTCTFVNVKHPRPELGSITIIKNGVPDGAQDFAFTTTGTGLSSFSLDDDADATLSNQKSFTGLAAGNYSVMETLMTGWTLSSITCSTGGSGNTTTGTASIVLAAGANVTCTFVNTQVVQGSGNLPSTGGPATVVREGTQAGNPPLPNTAMPLGVTGSTQAALLALASMLALGAVGVAVAVEGRRRR